MPGAAKGDHGVFSVRGVRPGAPVGGTHSPRRQGAQARRERGSGVSFDVILSPPPVFSPEDEVTKAPRVD